MIVSKEKLYWDPLTNSICNDDDILTTLQNWATLRERLAPRKVFSGVDNNRMNPYKRPFRKQSCLMPGHTHRPLLTWNMGNIFSQISKKCLFENSKETYFINFPKQKPSHQNIHQGCIVQTHLPHGSAALTFTFQILIVELRSLQLTT